MCQTEKNVVVVKIFIIRELRALKSCHCSSWWTFVLQYYERCPDQPEMSHYMMTGEWLGCEEEKARGIALHSRDGEALILSLCELLNRHLYTLNMAFWIFRLISDHGMAELAGKSGVNAAEVRQWIRDCRFIQIRCHDKFCFVDGVHEACVYKPRTSTQIERETIARLADDYVSQIHDCEDKELYDLDDVMKRVGYRTTKRLRQLIDLIGVPVLVSSLMPHVKLLDWQFIMHPERSLISDELLDVFRAALPRDLYEDSGDSRCIWNWVVDEIEYNGSDKVSWTQFVNYVLQI